MTTHDGSLRTSGQPLLTPRDREVIIWIAEQGAVGLGVVAALLGRLAQSDPVTLVRARQLCNRWIGLGLAARRRHLVGEEATVWVTTAGLRFVGRAGRGRAPQVGLIHHYHAVASVRFGLEDEGISSWVPERDIVRGWSHRPDGIFYRDGEAHAVEVELTEKSGRRLEHILSDLGSSYPRILYVVSTRHIGRAVSSVAEGVGLDDRVEIRELEEFRV